MDSFDAKLSRSHFGFAHFDVPARLHRREKGLNASAIRRRAFLGLDWRGKGCCSVEVEAYTASFSSTTPWLHPPRQ